MLTSAHENTSFRDGFPTITEDRTKKIDMSHHHRQHIIDRACL